MYYVIAIIEEARSILINTQDHGKLKCKYLKFFEKNNAQKSVAWMN